MKYVILLIFLNSSFAFSQKLKDMTIDDQINPFEAELQWLYEKIIPQDVIRDFPKESYKSFRVHLKDSFKNFPQPDLIMKKNLKLKPIIQGTISYVGIVKKKYIYDVIVKNKTVILNVRVHLKNPNATDLNDFKSKLDFAAQIWNSQRIKTDFDYEFQFEIVTDKSKAHFSVNVKDSTRGPYDENWSRAWTATAIAHEIGHMLGLGDEYQTLSGQTDCWRDSLMCESWTAVPQKHHYYFILRRLII
jgi:hypothetical protein